MAQRHYGSRDCLPLRELSNKKYTITQWTHFLSWVPILIKRPSYIECDREKIKPKNFAKQQKVLPKKKLRSQGINTVATYKLFEDEKLKFSCFDAALFFIWEMFNCSKQKLIISSPGRLFSKQTSKTHEKSLKNFLNINPVSLKWSRDLKIRVLIRPKIRSLIRPGVLCFLKIIFSELGLN